MMLLALSLSAAAETPALVTLAQGPVTLVSAESSAPAPAAPFLVPPAGSLELGAGAHVVVLRQGGAVAVDGPPHLDPASLHAAVAADAVGSALDKHTSLASVGAARAGGLVVTRPVAGYPLLSLHQIRWRCDACGVQQVAVIDLHADAAIRTATGEGAVRYDGPALAPGTYAVRVGEVEAAFRVVPAGEAEALLTAAHLDAIADPRDRAAATAGTLLVAGYPTDALDTLDAAGLADLAQGYERALGLSP